MSIRAFQVCKIDGTKIEELYGGNHRNAAGVYMSDHHVPECLVIELGTHGANARRHYQATVGSGPIRAIHGTK